MSRTLTFSFFFSVAMVISPFCLFVVWLIIDGVLSWSLLPKYLRQSGTNLFSLLLKEKSARNCKKSAAALKKNALCPELGPG
jgi:hypothetical protein